MISYSCMNNTKQIINNHNKCIPNSPKHTDKHTSDSQKTASKLATETTLHHSVTQNTGTLPNSVNMSVPLRTTTLTILFHGVSFHLAHPTAVQVKDVTFASKRNF